MGPPSITSGGSCRGWGFINPPQSFLLVILNIPTDLPCRGHWHPPPPKNSCIRPWSYVGLIHLFIFPMGVVLFRKSVKEDWNTLNMWNNLISTYTLFIRARTNNLLIESGDTYIGVSILCTSIISKYIRQYNQWRIQGGGSRGSGPPFWATM